MTTRYVAVDLETTSLDTSIAFPLEIAAVSFDPHTPGTYEHLENFVPYHERHVVNQAEPEALTVNRYYERRLYRDMLDQVATDHAIDRLVDLLDGATLVGAHTAYDAAILWQWMRDRRPDLGRAPWHFRLYDVEVAAAALLGLDEIPSLKKAAGMFGLTFATLTGAHTAYGDACLAADVCSAVITRRATVDTILTPETVVALDDHEA